MASTAASSTYRADNVGSFLRPKELLDARHADADPDRLREIEDREMLRILAKQQALGFEIFTDGEFRRGGFMTDLTDSVDGFDSEAGMARTWKAAGAATGVAPSAVRGIVTEKLRQTRRLTEHETTFLKQHSPGPIKMTLPSATQFPAIAYKKGISERAYPNHRWYASGGYDAIAEKLFHELDVNRFLLEYDDERSGSFEPLRLVPKGKTVVLGLVSTTKPELEDRATLLRRIEDASRYIPLENLALSPRCGFASMAEGNLITEADQWAKLVVDTARKVWG